MSARWMYLNRALTGRFDPIMLSAKKEWDKSTGENSFTRLDCLHFALTRWGIHFKRGFFFFLPAGGWCWINDKHTFHINCVLFSLYWMKNK